MGEGNVTLPKVIFCEPTAEPGRARRVRELLLSKGFDSISFSGITALDTPHSSLDPEYDGAFKDARLLILWFPCKNFDIAWAAHILTWAITTPVFAYVEAGSTNNVAQVASITGLDHVKIIDEKELLHLIEYDITQISI